MQDTIKVRVCVAVDARTGMYKALGTDGLEESFIEECACDPFQAGPHSPFQGQITWHEIEVPVHRKGARET